MIAIFGFFWGWSYLVSAGERKWSRKVQSEITQTKSEYGNDFLILDSTSMSGVIHWISKPWTIRNPVINRYLILKQMEQPDHEFATYYFLLQYVTMREARSVWRSILPKTDYSGEILVRFRCDHSKSLMVSVVFEEETGSADEQVLAAIKENEAVYNKGDMWIVDRIHEDYCRFITCCMEQ